MEEEAVDALRLRYYCHACSLTVQPVLGVEEIQCPHCHSGFLEEMASGHHGHANGGGDGYVEADAVEAVSDLALSLLAPFLIDIVGNPSRRHDDEDGHSPGLRYRYLAFQQLLNATRGSEGLGDADDYAAAGEREHLVFMRDSLDAANAGPGMSARDFLLGPGLDLLLQYLAQTDPGRQGTPPAKKEAVAAMPTVSIQEVVSCPVCLEEFAVGDEAREMPCKHAFHDKCIMPWLGMHSSCPVCRYQMPTDEPKEAAGNGHGAEGSGSGNGNRQEASESGNRQEASGNGNGNGDGDGGGNGRRHWFPWPFTGLFSQWSQGNSSSSRSPPPPSSGSRSHL